MKHERPPWRRPLVLAESAYDGQLFSGGLPRGNLSLFVGLGTFFRKIG
jgi:hypothetical protein